MEFREPRYKGQKGQIVYPACEHEEDQPSREMILHIVENGEIAVAFQVGEQVIELNGHEVMHFIYLFLDLLELGLYSSGDMSFNDVMRLLAKKNNGDFQYSPNKEDYKNN